MIDSDTDEVLLRANVGHAAARLLAEVLNADHVVGLAWARSLVAMRTSHSRLAACPVVHSPGRFSVPTPSVVASIWYGT